MTKKKDSEDSGILSQEEINDLLDLLSCGSKSLRETWKDANDMQCAKSNLKKVKTPQDYFDVILNFVEEREEYRKMIVESRNTISELEDNLRLVKEVLNKLIK